MPSVRDLPPFFPLNTLRLGLAEVKEANNVYNVLFIQRETTSKDEAIPCIDDLGRLRYYAFLVTFKRHPFNRVSEEIIADIRERLKGISRVISSSEKTPTFVCCRL